MTCEYSLPERQDDEDNWAWCQRAVASIPDDAFGRIMEKAVRRSQWKKSRRRELWSHVEEVSGHGSGVSNAFVRRWEAERAEAPR